MQIISEKDGSIFDLLIVLYPESSKATLRSWIKEGRVTVDNKLIKRTDEAILKNQTIIIGPKKNFTEEKLPILYEDRYIVVVDKPEGLLSVATAFEKGKTVHGLLKEKFKPRKVFVVHRLDQETSGVMLFALSEDAYIKLKEKFAAHEMERIYTGIVEGRMTSSEGTWSSYLREDANYVVHSSQNPQAGSLAITHYEVLKVSTRFSRVQFKLETGRKNQIRVHCQVAGHPILGDKKYGSIANSSKRLCLHARSLAFTHPITDVNMYFTSPLPELFNRII
jgi:23S rRNA pseudouridine1911/1915/1917 synthase